MMTSLLMASDHAGYDLKQALIGILQTKGFTVIDKGCHSTDRVDYPDLAHILAVSLQHKEAPWGILVCGSGIGMSIAANRHKGIRAALVQNVEQAKLARAHNDANVLCLGARIIDLPTALTCIEAFLTTPFEEGRHTHRVHKIEPSLHCK